MLDNRLTELSLLKTLILSGCSKINILENDIVQMESLITLIAENTAMKQVPFSFVISKSIGYISLCGFEGFSHSVFPSVIRYWMSPTMNPISYICSFPGKLSSLNSAIMQDNDLGDLAPMLSNLSNLRSVMVQCHTKFQLSEQLETILSDVYGVNYTKIEMTSQISKYSSKYYLNGIGNCEVLDTLSNSISEVPFFVFIYIHTFTTHFNY